MLTGRAISDDPCRCRRRASVFCLRWGRQVGLMPGMGFPLVASRRAVSCSIRANSCCTSLTTKTKAWMQYVIFSMAWPRDPRLGEGAAVQRSARGGSRAPPPGASRGGRPWSATGDTPRHGGGHARAPRQGGHGHAGQADAEHGTGDQAWGRWRTGQTPQTVSPGGA
jgi:hypothetical protein